MTEADSTRRAELLEMLRELAYEQREVVLSSGQRSNFYIDCKQVSLDARGAQLIGQVFYAEIARLAPSARAVGGMTLGADPLATATSIVSHQEGRPLAAFIVRKEPKGHGTGQWVEHGKKLGPGTPVVILEDVITTGASTLRAIERARAAGFDVVHVVALVDRLEGGTDAVRAQAPVTAVFTRKDFA